MKDWLGQADHCAFWAILLRALCANGSASVFATSNSQMVSLFIYALFCYDVFNNIDVVFDIGKSEVVAIVVFSIRFCFC